MSGDSSDLSGKLLIAMPGMGDPRFEKSVIFMCAHSPDGSMGLIVNKPAPGLKMDDLLEQLKIPRGDGSRGIAVHFGGPVEHGRGFVLHSGDYQTGDGTLQVDERFGMTSDEYVEASVGAGLKGGAPGARERYRRRSARSVRDRSGSWPGS